MMLTIVTSTTGTPRLPINRKISSWQRALTSSGRFAESHRGRTVVTGTFGPLLGFARSSAAGAAGVITEQQRPRAVPRPTSQRGRAAPT